MSNENVQMEAGAPSFVSQAVYRDAMARLGTAVNVVTTDGPSGRAGFTASAVCSVTDSPPTLLVCVNRNSSSYASVLTNRVLCVNTLSDGHESLSRTFGSKASSNERFAAGNWSTLETGAPVLNGALVAFDCRVVEVVQQGTHDVFFCQVEAIRDCAEAQGGLVYFARRYHSLAHAIG
ncbi:flavin reductase [Paraburkholderia sp. BCC1884]|uniref:flavin reductase n=1 Tax=Paraburkholderia sp. BCC1884 TaxID=2562668 RepID=UPI001181E4CE|nr:flavin reductase [Paraburkholderia sp. BCC1884]